ncbi:MAG: hypothetical protein KDK64_08570 [Chlamydiia bacterium]|nr:hypothetical protein [Chlamydiia bacterium]
MKKLIFALLATATTVMAHEKEISFSELHEFLPTVNEITSVVIKVNPGDELPLQFSLSGDLLKLEHTPENGTLKALEPLYIKLEPSFLFSQDKKDWKSFESFFTGMLGVSVGKEASTTGEIFLELKKR